MGKLNKEQREAITDHRGVSLVLAGAGTGKTRTLVEKVQALIRERVCDPREILIFTFNRKAAGEIRERIENEIGDAASAITAGTFHHVALSLLREYGTPFLEGRGYRTFPGVLDEVSRYEVMRGIVLPLLDRFKGIPISVVAAVFMQRQPLASWVKKKLDRHGISDVLREVRTGYDKYKIDAGLMDYDDIIDLAVRLLRSDSAVRTRLTGRFRYLLVDEFQDTSSDTFSLLRLLMPDQGGRLFAVGDDWQSIYGFRDARIDYLVNMRVHFPGVATYRLTMNYRSRQEILQAAGRFIRRNRYRTRKRIISGKGKGGLVALHGVADFMEEADCIATLLGARELQEAGSVAILFRNNWQRAGIMKRLDECGIGGKGAGPHLMTMHASKGLEFDAVIIAGIADHIMPDRGGDIEEERRLLYVAMTRAREQLHIIGHFNERGERGLFMKELGFGN